MRRLILHKGCTQSTKSILAQLFSLPVPCCKECRGNQTGDDQQASGDDRDLDPTTMHEYPQSKADNRN